MNSFIYSNRLGLHSFVHVTKDLISLLALSLPSSFIDLYFFPLVLLAVHGEELTHGFHILI